MFEKAHQKITTITSANDLMKFTETFNVITERKFHTHHIFHKVKYVSFESRQIENRFKLKTYVQNLFSLHEICEKKTLIVMMLSH